MLSKYVVHYLENNEAKYILCSRWTEQDSFVKCITKWTERHTEEEKSKTTFIPLASIIKIEDNI